MARLGIRTTAAAMGAAVLLVTRMFFRRWRRRPHHDRSRNGSGLTGHHQYPGRRGSPVFRSDRFHHIRPDHAQRCSGCQRPPFGAGRSLRTVWPAPTPPLQVVQQPWIPTYATFRSALTVALFCRWIAR